MSDLDDDLREEIESHLAMRAAHDGVTRADAVRKFGNRAQTQEAMRRMHVPMLLDEIRQDLRYAWRRAAQMPGFTFAVVAAIALGVGSSTAVFSVVDRILFRPLPYVHEEQLVWLGMTAPIGGGEEFLIAGDYFDWKEQQQPFSHFTSSGGNGTGSCDITEGAPVQVRCHGVDYDYLETFGIRPVVGRGIERTDDPESILISHKLWQSRYGGDPGVTGRTLQIDGKPKRIIGVLPANFEIPSLVPVDILRLQALNIPRERARKGPQSIINAWARLKPGVTVRQAEEAMRPVFQNSLQYVPKSFSKEVKLSVTGLRDRQTRRAAGISWTLLGAVASILLIACANVANLFLARASASQKDAAVRAAIGASRGRLMRQNFVESIALALAGGVLGIAFGYAGIRAANYFAPAGIPRLGDATLDGRVLLFSLAVTVLSGVLCGVATAMRPADPQSLMGSRATARRSWTRPVLVATQIALASVLLYAAALLGESFWRMQAVPLGLDTDNVVTARIQLPNARYANSVLAFWTQLRERVEGLPAVTTFAMASALPPFDRTGNMIYSAISVDGKPEDRSKGTGGMVAFRAVSPRYFEALRIRMLRGGTFEPAHSTNQVAAIVSERLARRLFGGSIDVIGRSIRLGTGEPWRTVVGVAADVVNAGDTSSDPEYYLPLDEQAVRLRVNVAMRTNGQTTAMQDLIRAEIAQIDPQLPVQFGTLHQDAGKMTEGSRFNALVLGFFALIGLALGANGVYAVVSFLVSQRTREIGVRMALGATSDQIRGLILRYALICAAAGCVAAGAMMFAVMPRLRGLLFDTKTVGWTTGAAVLIAMASLALLAALAPALRAGRLDPVEALRQEG